MYHPYIVATIPCSLFKAYSTLISRSEGKSAVIKVILENTGVEKTTVTPTHIDCVVIDAIHVVNEINLKIALLKIGADFADAFDKRIGNLSQHTSMIMIVYDRYEKRSLKNATRSKQMGKWSKKMSKTFAINEMTNIEGVTMDELMEQYGNKRLVMFLMRTTELYLKSQHVYYIMAGNGNIPSNYVDDSATNHEEADSLVIYCLVNATEKIVDKAVTVYFSDTDVFMLLNFCNMVPCKILLISQKSIEN